MDLVYEPREDHVRDLLYRVQEGKRLEVSLLAGYGSYEMLRGGVEIRKTTSGAAAIAPGSKPSSRSRPQAAIYLHGAGIAATDVDCS